MCTQLWCEAHLQVTKLKAPQLRSTFRRCDVEKVHAVVVRSTCASEKGKNISRSKHFWKLRRRKSARRCGAKHMSKSKCTKHTRSGPLLEVEMSKKCTPLWREAHFEVKMLKTRYVRTTFGRSDVVSRGRRKGLCILSKVSKTWGFCSISKNDGRRGTFEEYLQRCIIRGRRSTRDIFIRAVRRSGRWFPERGCILEHQIFILGRWFCVTGAAFLVWPSITFSWQAQYFRQVGWKKSQNALVRGRQLCTQRSIFEGSLAELFRFWCCQLRKLRKSRRIVSFLMLSSSKIEDVSQKCFVFDVVKFKNWGRLAELLRFPGRQTDRQTNR